MCVEDVAVREDVLYFYVGSGAELLAETESQVDVCAETYFPVVILKEIVWIEVYVGVILETSVAVECVVHGKSHADGLLIGDGTGDIGFGAHDIFFDIAHHEVVLALVDQQIGFGTELERHIVARGTYPEMYITRNEFLLVADEVGQEVEIALVELSGNIQIDFAESMYIIHGSMGTVVE